MAAEVEGEVGRRAVAGVRWILWISVAAAPLSFLTNTLLARVSALALGYYGAVMLFSSAFQTIGVLGGPKVFTRFVPILPGRDRVPFLLTYAGIVLGLLFGAVTLAAVFVPAGLHATLGRFGGPSVGMAVTLAVAIVLMTFTSHFLFGTLSGPAASFVVRFPILGFFLAALLGATVLRGSLLADPARFLWRSAVVVFLASALLAVAFTLRTAEFREPWTPRWLLPKGFWSAAIYTNMDTVVMFTYLNLAPTFVLLWLDVDSLAPFHASLRYLSLFEGVAGLLASLISPGLASLEAKGMRQEAFRQAHKAMSLALLVVVPASLVLVFFASDAMAVFGDAFRARADLLRILALSTLAVPIVQFGAGMLVAFGAYRSYLAASLVYVVAAVALVTGLIPLFGLPGAAWAGAASSLANALAVTVVLRVRLGFRVPGRIVAAFGTVAVAVFVAILLEPGRPLAALLLAVSVAAFAVAGRVTRREIENAVSVVGLRRATRR